MKIKEILVHGRVDYSPIKMCGCLIRWNLIKGEDLLGYVSNFKLVFIPFFVKNIVKDNS